MTVQQTILLTGSQGQIGFALARSLQGLGRLVALDRRTLDLSDLEQIRRIVREVRPTIIINAAAYTAVDQAEREHEAAMQINAAAPRVLAEEAARSNAVLFHYSTDYIFDGTKADAYVEDDTPNPQNVYGCSKLAGERAIIETGGAHFIFRTSWIYGCRGKNFMLTMQKRAAQSTALRIVADQTGAPTWCTAVAAISAQVMAQGVLATQEDNAWWQKKSGVYHLSAAGATSWYGFAQAIFALDTALMPKPNLVPIASTAYPMPAQRPINSQLSNAKLARSFGLTAPHWHDALRLCLST
jgi:dTDP-4-dehydrorhamnose reductase